MDHQHTSDDLRDAAKALRDLIPETYRAFAGLSREAMGDGALPRATKELIALSIAATRECDGCIAAHARNAVAAGVTRQEIAEAMGVVILMNGGPGTVWGPRALEAFDQFSED
jgi:AhpD family alkylhydroperoxidase